MTWMLLITSIALFSGCGGAAFEPQVFSVRTENNVYGENLRVQISGEYLNNEIRFDAGTHCIEPTFQRLSTTGLATVECRATTTGSFTLRILSASGSLLHETSVTIPDPQISISTTKGSFIIELYPDKAPITADNFLLYEKADFYEGTIFHRVINNFVVQAGGFNSDISDGLQPKATMMDPIALETNTGLSNIKYTVAMARTSMPNSATSQFYVNLKDNIQLDRVDDNNPGYAVFGKVISGFDTIESIAKSETTTIGVFSDVPVETIEIISTLRIK